MRTCGIPRSELFITSKVAAEHKSYKAAARSIDETLKRMQLDYLDMMIIHSPQPWNEWREENPNLTLKSRRMIGTSFLR